MNNTIAEVQAIQQAVELSFRGHALITAKVGDTPCVAVKPIVEGLGLDWRSQQAKITASSRYGHMSIPLQTAGGKQEMICIPLRKLNGWLFSINPAKVREDLREKVIAYQEECFEVLYKYWNEGIAVNHRFLTPEQQRKVQQAIAAKVHKLPKDQQRQGYANEYRRIKDAYLVGSYTQLPADKFDELMQFIDAEFVEPPAPAKQVKYHYPTETAKPPEMFSNIQQWMTYRAIADERFKNPLLELMKQHHENGDNVDGCWLVYKSMMHLLETYHEYIRGFEQMARGAQQRGLNVLFR